MIKRVVALGLFALIFPGCAHDATWLERQPAVESTIGNDYKAAPSGKVIKPPGMGVDLGDGSRDRPGSQGLDPVA